MNKIALFLVGKKGYTVLQSIANRYPDIITDVIGSRDSGVDFDYHNQIQELCKLIGIKFHDRLSTNFSPSSYDGYILAIGWRWMLPSENNILIIHDSLLPKYRGFAPLVTQLINGEKTIGATALFADKHYDKGRIITQSARSITYPIKISEAIDVMCDIYIDLTLKLIKAVLNNKNLKGVMQSESDATYSLWRDSEDYWINWNQSSNKIKRFIDAVGSPYAGARCLINDTAAVIHSAEVIPNLKIEDRKSSTGKVIFMEKDFPVVVCGHGLLKITNMTTPKGDSLIPLKKFRSRFFGKINETYSI